MSDVVGNPDVVQLIKPGHEVQISYHFAQSNQHLRPSFLAHLSRRLKGELIGYPCSVVRPFTISNIFSSKTACPIKAKFYMEPPLVGGTKVCSRHLGHMTRMAATPIYGRNPSKIFFSGTGGLISTKLGM